MLKISKHQIVAMDGQITASFARDLTRYFRAEHAEVVSAIDDAELLRRVEIGIARAERYGLTWDSAITGFIAIMFEVAPTFDEQPAIQRVLRDARVAPDVRIDALWDRTSEEDWDEAERYAEHAETFWRGATLQAG